MQTDIDVTQSALAVMHKRIDTAHLVLTYRSDAAPAASGVFAPVAHALQSSLGMAMQVVALMISLAAVLAPLAIAGALVAWPVRHWRKRRPKPAEASAPPSPI